MKRKHEYEEVNYLFKRDNFQVASNKDLFRHHQTKIVTSTPSVIDETLFFDTLKHIFVFLGLDESQVHLILYHADFHHLFLRAFTHYSYLTPSEYHLSNDYLERIGSYIMDQHVIRFLHNNHKLGQGISCQEHFSLVLQWFQKEHIAAPWLDKLGLTHFIRWSPIVIKNNHVLRSIQVDDTMKWSVFLALLAVTNESINCLIKPGLGELVLKLMLEPFWSTLDIDLYQMHLYKDHKSQISQLKDKQFVLEEYLHTPTNMLHIHIKLQYNDKPKIFKVPLPYNLKTTNWKLPIYTWIHEYLLEQKIKWVINVKRD